MFAFTLDISAFYLITCWHTTTTRWKNCRRVESFNLFLVFEKWAKDYNFHCAAALLSRSQGKESVKKNVVNLSRVYTLLDISKLYVQLSINSGKEEKTTGWGGVGAFIYPSYLVILQYILHIHAWMNLVKLFQTPLKWTIPFLNLNFSWMSRLPASLLSQWLTCVAQANRDAVG